MSRSYTIVFKEMKKIILLILSVLCLSTSAFADETSCRVWGTDAVATIKNPVTTIYNDNISIRVGITEPQDKKVNIVVNVYSTNNEVIASDIVTIDAGHTSQRGSYANIVCKGKDGDVVYVRIARASCQ